MGIFSDKLKALSKADLAAICLTGAFFIYMIVMSIFDGTISDEAFYISIPLRLINGDGLFTDEWHLSQLSAVLLYIPVRFFTLITGGTAGIIYYMRVLFCLMQTVCAAVTYKSFRKYGMISIIISISFMLFSVISLRTLSYNTMGFAMLVFMICTAISITEKPASWKMLISGTLTAMFVLCQPVGVVLYGIYFLAAICIIIVYTKKKAAVPYPFRLKSFMLTAAGILPVLIFFSYILLKNTDISTMLRCIPGILSDVEHMEIADELGIKTFTAFQFIIDMTMSAGVFPLIAAALSTVLAVVFRKKNRSLAAAVTAAGLFISSFICWICYFFIDNDFTETDDISFFYLPLALCGTAFYILCKNRNHKIYILLQGTGFLYALFMTVSSNLRLHASVNGYIIAAAGTLILAKELYDEMKAEKEISKLSAIMGKATGITITALAILGISFTVISETTTRAHFKSYKITEGIYSGIALPSDQAVIYKTLYKDAMKMKEILSEDDKLFVLENIPCVYLEGEFRMGIHSGWFICQQLGVREVRDRLREYYEIFPENIPDYIYVPSYIYGEDSLERTPSKRLAEFAYMLFDGENTKLGDGVLIKVNGVKNETY